jgi:phospholipid transport system transporter-binding protein
MSAFHLDMDSAAAKAAGELTLGTAQAVLSRWPTVGDARKLDLSGITRMDTAGLSVLLHWCRAAREKDQPLSFVNISDQLGSFIKVAGLTSVINSV